MAIESIASGYGSPARRVLADVVGDAKADDAFRPVTVVVATNSVGVAARRFLAGELGGIIGLDVVTVLRLAERFGTAAVSTGGRRPLSTPILAGAVRSALRTEPGLFDPVAEHQTTEAGLVRVHRELSALADHQLDVLARQSPRAATVVDLHRRVRASLGRRWFDEHELLDAARDAIGSTPGAIAAVGTVVWFLPQRLTAPQGRFARALAEHVPVTVIAGLTGHDDADRTVVAGLANLGIDLRPDGAEVGSGDGSAAARALSVSDPDDEVRSAIRAVVERATAGSSLDRMAVLHPREVPYERLLHDQLTAAGIPFHATRGRPLHEFVVARRLRRFLALGDHSLRRADVMALLRDLEPDRSPEWEIQSRDAGVVNGPDWTERLDRHVGRLHSMGAEVDDRRRAVPGRAARHSVELRDRVLDMSAALDRGVAHTTWAGLASWCTELLDRLLAPSAALASWPDDEIEAAARVRGVVERLGELDAVDPGCSFRSFRRTLELELAEARVSRGRAGRGLLVGPLGAALGVPLDFTVVLGMAEGTIPATPSDDSLLPDRERAEVGDPLASVADASGDQHRHLLIAMAESAETLLVRPRSDLRRTARLEPSRLLPGSVESTEIESFVAGTARARRPASGRDWALGRLLAVDSAADPAALTEALLTDRALDLGARLVAGRGSRAFTRFDGNLSHLAIPSPLDRVQSASRLEQWLSCPHAYLLEHVLRVAVVDEPETVAELAADRTGSMIHDVLDRFVSEGLDRPHGQAWPDGSAGAIRELLAAVAAATEDEGGVGRPVAWNRLRARLTRELEEFVERDSERMIALGLSPVATELGFGSTDAQQPPIEIPLGDRRTLRLRGAIDRIDRDRSGRLVVTDYKHGSPDRYKDIGADTPLGDGTRLQLPIYGLAARRWAGADDADIAVRYWFTSERGRFEEVGYDLDEAILDEAIRVIDGVVTGIEQGCFPARPSEPSSYQHFVPCVYCDPDGLGTKEAHERWRRMSDTGPLAAYRRLVEPDVEPTAMEVP